MIDGEDFGDLVVILISVVILIKNKAVAEKFSNSSRRGYGFEIPFDFARFWVVVVFSFMLLAGVVGFFLGL